MRIRLSVQDIDTVWSVLDQRKQGYIYFNDFCALQETKYQEADPYQLKAAETRIQDNLAEERKAERDRMAQELLSQLKNKALSTASQSNQAFGLASMPSESVDDLMRNRYNKEYLHTKQSKVDNVANSKNA